MRSSSYGSNTLKKGKIIFITLLFILSVTLVLIGPVRTAALNFKYDTDLSDADNIIYGEEVHDEAGRSISISPDINGDGIDEFLIGTEYYGEADQKNIGKTYIIFGDRGSWIANKHMADAPISFLGEKKYDRAGIITPAGDVNGDGFGDILIGAPFNDEGHGLEFITSDGSGQVYLFLGKKTGLEPGMNLQNADASFIGENTYDNVGYHISTAGDINGDGFDDFLIGTPNHDLAGLDSGKVYIIFGKATGWKRDVDLSAADSSFLGESQGDNFHTVANAGDVNKDGYDDILLGAPFNGANNEGTIYLVMGKKTGWGKNVTISLDASTSFLGEKSDNHLSKVTGLGDVNGDGMDDILLGAPDNNDGGVNAGKSYLVFGRKNSFPSSFDLVNADASFVGKNANDNTANVAGAGDVNGDGLNDLIIGGPYNDRGATDAGQVYLFLGRSTGWVKNQDVATADASFVSNTENGNAGLLLGKYQPGDVNNDGFDDILIGEPGNNDIGIKMGFCYLFFVEINQRPTHVTSLTTFSDPLYTKTMERVEIDETIYVRVTGDDQDPKRPNLAEVLVVSNYDQMGIMVSLIETGNNTGIFQGFVVAKELTHKSHNWIGVENPDTIKLQSVENDALIKMIPAGPRIKIEDLSIIDGEGLDGKTIYSGKNPYTLRIVINNSLGSDDLESIYVIWKVQEPVSSGRNEFNTVIRTIKLAWYPSPEAFEVVESPEGWISFNEPYSESMPDPKIFILYLKIDIGWLYPESSTSTITIETISNVLKTQWTNISKPDDEIFFRTVNKMKLTGELDVNGDIQGELGKGDIVLAGEKLSWTGLRAVYVDPLNPDTAYATPGTLKVRAVDSKGNSWFGDIPPDVNISMEFNAPDNNDPAVEFRFSLSGIPAESDLSDIVYTLVITNTRPLPPHDIVIHADSFDDINTYADNDLELHVTWQEPISHPYDIAGYYLSFTNSEFTSYGTYSDEASGVIYLSKDRSEVTNGVVHVFVWAVDTYGSIGFADSAMIIVDNEPVAFTNATPQSDSLFSKPELTFSIMISDIGGSGVDGSLISYHKSTTGLDGWTQWEDYGTVSSGSLLMCTATTTLDEGDDNYFQWRAKDLAGNGYTLSETIRVVIDTGIKNILPTVSLQSPENDSIVTTDSPILYWHGVDLDGDELSYDVYFSTNYSKAAEFDNSVLVASGTPYSQFISSMPLSTDETYYWTVIPHDGRNVGTCFMGVWSFHVDVTKRTSTTRLLLPHDNSILTSVKPTLMWTVDYEGSGPVTITYDVYLDTIPNPTKIVATNQVENYFNPWFPLQNGQLYYWKIIPYANDLKGTCENGVWQFLVDLNFSYEIKLKTEYDLMTLHQDEFRSVSLYISNKGNQPDTIKLTAVSDDIKDLSFNETEIILPRFDRGVAILNIHIPRDYKEGTYTVKVKIVSEGARIQGQEIEDEATITIKVIKSSETIEKEELMSILTALAFVVIALNAILVFSFVMNRRAKRDSEKFKTLYYIHKYSKNKPGAKKGGSQKSVIRTEPIGIAGRIRMELDATAVLKEDRSYSLEERLAILKYLRNTNKITGAQYQKGLLSLREKLVAKRSDRKEPQKPETFRPPVLTIDKKI